MTAAVRWGAMVPSGLELRSIKQSALYHVAAPAFLEKGYHGTTLNDIAASFGVKKATLLVRSIAADPETALPS